MKGLAVTRRRLWAGLLLAAVGVAAPPPAAAQVVPVGVSSARFSLDLSNPGARSLGMGGAFSGLADDATAAYANPAGLSVLTRPEVSLEGRLWHQEVPFALTRLDLDRGTPGDARADVFAVDTSREADVSFASYVHPLGRWSLAVYRHALVRLDAGVEGDFALDNFADRINSRTTLDVTGTGAAAAFRLTPQWSLGASVARYEGSLLSREERRFASLFDDPSIEDADVGVVAGVLWRSAGPDGTGGRWSAGTFYRSHLDFQVQSEVEGLLLTVPASYGVGAGWRPRPELVVALDLARLLYSRTADGFATPHPATFGEFRADDVWELRAGMELSLWRLRWVPTLRLGAWFEPDHKVRFEPAGDFGPITDVLRTAFSPGRDEWHWSAGFGVVLADRLQVDAAADFSDSRDTFSLSGVVRF